MRKTHLLFGMAAIPFLLLYAISAVQMAHREWFPLAPKVEKRTQQWQTGLTDARQLAPLSGVRGELRNVNPASGGLTFTIVRPGETAQVEYKTESGRADITIRTAGVLGVLNRLHHAAGFYHELRELQVWAGAVLAVSIALAGLSATGLILAFRKKRDRKTSGIVLAVHLLVSLTVLAMLRWQ